MEYGTFPVRESVTCHLNFRCFRRIAVIRHADACGGEYQTALPDRQCTVIALYGKLIRHVIAFAVGDQRGSAYGNRIYSGTGSFTGCAQSGDPVICAVNLEDAAEQTGYGLFMSVVQILSALCRNGYQILRVTVQNRQFSVLFCDNVVSFRSILIQCVIEYIQCFARNGSRCTEYILRTFAGRESVSAEAHCFILQRLSGIGMACGTGCQNNRTL